MPMAVRGNLMWAYIYARGSQRVKSTRKKIMVGALATIANHTQQSMLQNIGGPIPC